MGRVAGSGETVEEIEKGNHRFYMLRPEIVRNQREVGKDGRSE
jgi:hypothetical protein